MRKKNELFKKIQLLLYILITVVGLVVIFTDDALYQLIGRDPSARLLCILLWLALAVGYVSIYIDFSTLNAFKKDYYELEYVAHNDHIAGIANRHSCDAMIEKYMDKPLDDGICSVMFDMSNLKEINEKFGHAAGNDAILEFSGILHTASLGLCFVGRNGGNKFMALFENCTEETLNTFLAKVAMAVNVHNAHPDAPPIEYRKGYAFNKEEHMDKITRLIALSDRRLYPENDTLTGISNRAGCDEIINMYIEKELPEDIGCMMMEIINIRDINDRFGHAEGTRAIRHFGEALREASEGMCFVGRNGGTKFLAVFEHCTEEKMKTFADRVREKTDAYNRNEEGVVMEYETGIAFHEDKSVDRINRLVALSDRRLQENKQKGAAHVGST